VTLSTIYKLTVASTRYKVWCSDPSAITEADLDLYTTAYSAAGAMRAGFELYRAFDQDAQENRSALERNGKLKIPVLAIFGSISNTSSGVVEMMHEVAENVTGLEISRSGHWIAEENPGELATSLHKVLAT
jgi:pimeloyl-ACP methyl ester carboxylesterase